MLGLFSFMFMLLILAFWFWKLFKMAVIWPLRVKNNQSKTGTIKDGRITQVKTKGKKRLNIEVEFSNFSGTAITESFQLVDSKPEQHRYEVGKRVTLILTGDAKKPVIIQGGVYKNNPVLQLFSTLMFATYIYGCYWFISKAWDKMGGSLDGYAALNGGFIVVLLGGIYLFVLLLVYFIFKAVGLIPTKKKTEQNYNLKYYGVKTIAEIKSYKATGTKINNNPMVLFKYQFSGPFNDKIEGEDKLLIDQLAVGSLVPNAAKEVFYLPENPQINALTAALNSTNLPGCMKGILLFLTFVFSCVVLGLFIGLTIA